MKPVGRIVARLRAAYAQASSGIKKMPDRDPFRILISAVLSTRTQDTVTAASVKRLFDYLGSEERAPARLARLPSRTIARLIYPVGFYHTKARILKKLANEIAQLGRVPDTMPELLRLPGVGRKVANIVLSRAMGIPALAVDTHVHRISNRLGLVSTRNPIQTEQALKNVLPKRYWIEWNYLLVSLGQTICRPRNPRCPGCPVKRWCDRIGVKYN